MRAIAGTRTPCLRLTMATLYQVSYDGGSTAGGIRTRNYLILNQAPLPVGAPRPDVCGVARLLDGLTRRHAHQEPVPLRCTPSRNAEGRGLEPLQAGPKPAVLPIRPTLIESDRRESNPLRLFGRQKCHHQHLGRAASRGFEPL
jgi:hypothetical protein